VLTPLDCDEVVALAAAARGISTDRRVPSRGVPTMGRLPAGEVRVDWLDARSREAGELLARASDVLDEVDRQDCERLFLPEKRREATLARVFLRTRLALYGGAAPRSFRFTRSAHGRPEIDWPIRCRALRFSVSHTPGVIACAFAEVMEVGVDVERLAREPTGVAELYFAPSEIAALARSTRRSELFFEIWTLKEAYAKARGFGLSGPFAGAAFSFDASRITARFAPELEDDPAQWHFERRRPTNRHTLALAVRLGDRTPRCRTFRNLGGLYERTTQDRGSDGRDLGDR
jgi:4'-phosphopantetheinyl transferase